MRKRCLTMLGLCSMLAMAGCSKNKSVEVDNVEILRELFERNGITMSDEEINLILENKDMLNSLLGSSYEDFKNNVGSMFDIPSTEDANDSPSGKDNEDSPSTEDTKDSSDEEEVEVVGKYKDIIANLMYTSRVDFSKLKSLEDMGFNKPYTDNIDVTLKLFEEYLSEYNSKVSEAYKNVLLYKFCEDIITVKPDIDFDPDYIYPLDKQYTTKDEYNSMKVSSMYGGFNSKGEHIANIDSLDNIHMYTEHYKDGCFEYSYSFNLEGNQDKVKYIVVPECVTKISIKDSDIKGLVILSPKVSELVIKYCPNLEHVYMVEPEYIGGSLEIVECPKLKTIDTSRFKGVSIAFCDKINNLDLSNAVVINDLSFCENLSKVYFKDKLLYASNSLFGDTKIESKFKGTTSINGVLVNMQEFNGDTISGLRVIPRGSIRVKNDTKVLSIKDCQIIGADLENSFPKVEDLNISDDCRVIGYGVLDGYYSVNKLKLSNNLLAVGQNSIDCNVNKEVIDNVKPPLFVDGDCINTLDDNEVIIWSDTLIQYSNDVDTYNVDRVTDSAFRDTTLDTITINPVTRFCSMATELLLADCKTIIVNGDMELRSSCLVGRLQNSLSLIVNGDLYYDNIEIKDLDNLDITVFGNIIKLYD